MLFLIGENYRESGILAGYRFYESITSVVFSLSVKDTIILAKSSLLKSNFRASNDQVIISEWTNEFFRDTMKSNETNKFTHILVNKHIDSDKSIGYRIISPVTNLSYNVTDTIFDDMVKRNEVLNCKMTQHGIKMYDCVNMLQDTEDKKHLIDEQYNLFRSKSSLLGHNYTFDYSIIENEVVIKNINSTDNTFIVPEFATVIAVAACNIDINSLILHNKLKIIGNKAFKRNNISKIEIPESVVLIGKDTFRNEKRKYECPLRLLNENTVVMNRE